MRERTFNRMRRQLFRKRISLAEVAGGAAVLLLLVLAVGWVAAQHDNFDPAERDLSFAVLQEQSVEDHLYKTPLKPWVEPGSGTGAAAGPRLGVFPAELLADGWRVGTRLQEFDPDNLYVKINGAAEQYLRFGFKALHYIGLAREGGPEEIGIELYDQGDFAGGLGIFSAQRDPAKPVQREGTAYYYETGAGAIGVMGRWFFKLAGNGSSPAIQAKSRQVVAALATLPTAPGDVPFGFRVMAEALALPFGQIAYRPVNVFQFDFARDFWFGTITPGQDARWFVHRATAPDAAAELYEQLLNEQRYDYDIVSESEERTVMRHRFLKNSLVMVLDGPLIYGVENAASNEAALAAVERLAAAVRGLDEKRT